MTKKTASEVKQEIELAEQGVDTLAQTILNSGIPELLVVFAAVAKLIAAAFDSAKQAENLSTRDF